MSRYVLNLVRLAIAALLLYLFAFSGGTADMRPIAMLALLLALCFEVAFWVTLFSGRGKGHVRVEPDA
ncbi:MAG: hypothetical protein AAGE94_09030 [Acidobacteriota bacterium]